MQIPNKIGPGAKKEETIHVHVGMSHPLTRAVSESNRLAPLYYKDCII